MDIRAVFLGLLPLVMLLQACSSTPFGQQLSESFDGQDAAQTGSTATCSSGTVCCSNKPGQGNHWTSRG